MPIVGCMIILLRYLRVSLVYWTPIIFWRIFGCGVDEAILG